MNLFRYAKIGLLISLFVLILVSCVPEFLSPPQKNESTTIPPVITSPPNKGDFVGNWICVDDNRTWEIRSSVVRVNLVPVIKDLVYSSVSDRIITVQDGNEKYTLYALAKAEGVVDGRVMNALSNTPMPGVKVSVIERDPRGESISATTDSDGRFTLEKLIVGEDYILTTDNGVEFEFSAKYDGEDIGDILVSEGENYKVLLSKVPDSMFPEESYDIEVKVVNLLDTNSEVYFQVTPDEGLDVSVTSSLGSSNNYITMGPKETKTISLTVSCHSFDEDSVYKNIGVKVINQNRKEWSDRVQLKFFKEYIELNVTSEDQRPIQCLVLDEKKSLGPYEVSGSGTTKRIPSLMEDSLIVVYGKDPSIDTVYSIAINAEAYSKEMLLGELSKVDEGLEIYEPDDRGQYYTIGGGETLVSYLGKGDVDIFNVELVHSLSESYTETPPTCTEGGYSTYHCNTCGKDVALFPVPPLGHTDNGNGICSVCGAYLFFGVTSSGELFVLDGVDLSENIVIPREIGEVTVTSIPSQCFENQSGVISINIPETVTTIGANAFSNCSSLNTVTVPNSVTTIGGGAFSGCSGLEEITLPFVGGSRSTSGSEALFGYIFGSYQYEGGIMINQKMNSYSTSPAYIPSTLRKVTITNAETIPNGSFSNYIWLEELNLNDEIKEVGDYAFYNCSSLSGAFDMPQSVTEIGSYAFFGCSSITELEIPSAVSTIENYTFYGCSGISSFELGDGIISLGSHNFENWRSEQSITIHCDIGLLMIENSSYDDYIPGYNTKNIFTGSEARVSLILSPATKRIPAYAFYGWDDLVSVVIPPSVTRIGEKAFNACGNLTYLNYDPTSTELGANALPFGFFASSTTVDSPVIMEKGMSQESEEYRLVSISSEEGSSVYYTLGDIAPTTASSSYNPESYYNYLGESVKAIKIPVDEAINAVAYKDGIYSQVEIKEPPLYPVHAVERGFSYDKETVYVSLECDSEEAEIYYTIDGSNPSVSSILYSPSSYVNSEGVINTCIAVPDGTTIKYCSFYKGFYSPIETHRANAKTISFVLQGQWDTYYGSGLSQDDYYSYYSTSNYNVHNSTAKMYINIMGYDTFTIYIRSNAESNYDYTIAYEVDFDTPRITTSGFQKADGSNLSNYKAVTYTGLDGESHSIRIDYRKDGSGHSGDDRGYLIVPKNQ